MDQVLVTLEIRIDQVRDDFKQKNTIKEFILTNGGHERGGLARFRAVEHRKKLSIFVSMKRIYEIKWLFDIITNRGENPHPLDRRRGRGFTTGGALVKRPPAKTHLTNNVPLQNEPQT
ncbi:hypothetical protein BpHYR1_042315 [Brachionus plicatilis]|uniref:Uncharacterized protein n=1 Tax=Brachionus plicatilis TaxID=10195 RepID=A0A3M7TA65_BRAPC|nr:hypothetical protein BpHYR1_042315 [Brachionus plicatilis]